LAAVMTTSVMGTGLLELEVWEAPSARM